MTGLFSSAFDQVPVDLGGVPADAGELPAVDTGDLETLVPEVGQADLPDFSDADEVLAYAQSFADSMVGQAPRRGGSRCGGGSRRQRRVGVFDPFIQAIVCPILLEARAQTVAVFNALEAAFPALAPQLTAIEAAALAIIDALLEEFGCGVVSP